MTLPALVRHRVESLGLAPHREGGFYREIFRSAEQVTPADGRDTRSALTVIHFLLPAGAHSRWHQVTSDEVWHLYEGGPLELLELDESLMTMTRHRLASIGDSGGAPVHSVRSRCWQAARPLGAYVLVGCTVGPGFEFADFRLLADDPQSAAIVRDRWSDVGGLI